MAEKIPESDPHHNSPELIWIGTRYVHPAEIEFCNLYANPRKLTDAEGKVVQRIDYQTGETTEFTDFDGGAE